MIICKQSIIFSYLSTLPFWQLFIFVFIVTFLLDVFYTKWVQKINEISPKLAGLFSVLITICSVSGFGSILEMNDLLIIPALIAAYFGTYIPVKHRQFKERNK